MLSRCRSSSSTTSTRRTPWRQLGFELLERLDQLLALDRLQRVADRAALERLVRVVGDRDDVDRNVPRVGVALQLIEDAQARVVRQVHVEQDRARMVERGGRQPVVRRCATTHWKPSSCARSQSTSANRASSSMIRMRRESCDRRSRSSSKLARGSVRASGEPRRRGRRATAGGDAGAAGGPRARGYRERPAPGRPAASA